MLAKHEKNATERVLKAFKTRFKLDQNAFETRPQRVLNALKTI